MPPQQFSLQPFPAPNPPRDLQLTVTITRQANVLALRYKLSDPRGQVVIPPRAKFPSRKDNLW
jgi:hypothetical protein